MALIIYPTTKYDSFVSVNEASSLIEKNVVDSTTWENSNAQEVYLRQATVLIKSKIDFDLIDDTDNLKLATALLANYAIGTDITNDNENGNLKVKEIVGVVKKEWFGKGKQSNAIPSNIASLLSEYGYSSSNALRLVR